MTMGAQVNCIELLWYDHAFQICFTWQDKYVALNSAMAAVCHMSKSTIPLKWFCVYPGGSYMVTVAARMGLFLAMHDTDTDVAMAYHESGSISHVLLSRAHLEREERRETQETGD